jgi:hypothetical protein
MRLLICPLLYHLITQSPTIESEELKNVPNGPRKTIQLFQFFTTEIRQQCENVPFAAQDLELAGGMV